MKFCRHDWHNHSTFGGQTYRHYFLRDVQYGAAAPVSIVLCLVLGLAFGYIIWALFNIDLLAIFGGILTSAGALLAFVINTSDKGGDVWMPANKSCIKCGIIRFDADKAQHKANVKAEKDKLKQAKRDRISASRSQRCREANDRFLKLQLLRQKTQGKA